MTDEQLADMRDLAETPDEIRAAYHHAVLMTGEARERGDFLSALMFRTTADDLQRRYFAARRKERR